MTTRPYHDKLKQIGDALDALHDQAKTLRAELVQLEELGITDASPYWRKNRDGEKTILTLTYSTNSERVQGGGSRSEYIGDKDASPEKVQAALDALDRYKDHLNLKFEVERIENKAYLVESQITSMLYSLGEQARLEV